MAAGRDLQLSPVSAPHTTLGVDVAESTILLSLHQMVEGHLISVSTASDEHFFVGTSSLWTFSVSYNPMNHICS